MTDAFAPQPVRTVAVVGRSTGRRFPREFLLYVALLAALVALAVPEGLGAAAGQRGDALFLLLLMVATSLLTVPALADQDVDWQLEGPVAVAAAVLLPPPVAVLVAFCGFTNSRELRLSTSPWLSLFNRAQIAVSVWIAALAAAAVLGERPDFPELVVGTVVAIAVHTLVGTLLWWVGHCLLHRADTVPALPRYPIDYLLVSALALPVVVVYENFSPLAVLLLAFPMGLGYSAIRSAGESAERAGQLAVQVRELETLNALGRRLVAESELDRVVEATSTAVRGALEADDVVVDLDGDIPPELEAVKVPGAEPAAIGVPPGLPDGSVAAVEAVAGLLGMSLQRIGLSDELAEVQRARVALSGRILEEGTRERSRIALDLHDHVLPELAAAEIQADNVRTALRRDQIAQAEQLAAVTQDAIHDGIGRLREVLDVLRSQIIVPGSLRRGLREALDSLKLEHGVEGDLAVPGGLPPLPLAVEILLLETVRGCLVNVGRHAGAERVSVRLEASHSGISASICDDGRGFDPAAVREGSHGLSLMAQRVGLARGHFEVVSAVGQGTRVHVEVPL